MRLGRLLMVELVLGLALLQVGCPGCGDPRVIYRLPGEEAPVGGGGSGCHRGEDCASGVCTDGVCSAPVCTDGVHNGTETDVDCGSDCSGCGAGQGCGVDEDCEGHFLCVGGVCSPCTEDAQCPAGLECREGGCVTDTSSPSVEVALLPRSTVLRVRYSEPVRMDDSATGALNPNNYCVELTDETPEECSPGDFFWLGSVLTTVDERTVDIELPLAPGSGRYTVIVSDAYSDGRVEDRAGNGLGSLRHADFETGGPLQVLEVEPVDRRRTRVTFSRAVSPGPDASGSAGCTSPATCASRYRLSGPTSLGAVLSAEVLSAPHDNEVLLTHEHTQVGASYSVLVANGVDGDGLDDAAAGALTPAEGGKPLGGQPLDRATFTGYGPESALSFGSGPVRESLSGERGASLFSYRGRLHLGPGGRGARVVRMEPDGWRPEDLDFRFHEDTHKGPGARTANAASAPFPSIGFAGCQANTHGCGPDNEDGRARFASGELGGHEWLLLGGSRSGGGLGYVYLTRDEDALLSMKYVDLSQALNGTALRSFSALGLFGGRAWMGVPSGSGTRKPELLALLRAPGPDVKGVDAKGNGRNGGACNPAVHELCNLAAHRMPGIGAMGSPANPASTVGIDFIGEFDGRLYLGNNGGLVRATVAEPLDYASAPHHWASITPSAAEYRGKVSLTSDKLEGLEPADRAWTRMVVFNGHVYLGRNTTEGPQLWRCDPDTVSGPVPASATDCDAGDWVLVAANGAGDARLSQFDNASNTRLTLLAVSGGHLYVGYDNAVDGVEVYRSAVPVPASRADFTGEGGCQADAAGCEGLGGNGFGAPADNTRFLDAVPVPSEGRGWLYVSVGGGASGPVRLYRQRD
ncbi:MAG TPA: dickkopf-related protein [Myxococcaceae bacterium]|nr:dickkopf-related protein [Myxococcaceae bacterium]